MTIYVITANGKVSSEGYNSYAAAIEFILSRSDSPEKVTAMHWRSDDIDYLIHDVRIKDT